MSAAKLFFRAHHHRQGVGADAEFDRRPRLGQLRPPARLQPGVMAREALAMSVLARLGPALEARARPDRVDRYLAGEAFLGEAFGDRLGEGGKTVDDPAVSTLPLRFRGGLRRAEFCPCRRISESTPGILALGERNRRDQNQQRREDSLLHRFLHQVAFASLVGREPNVPAAVRRAKDGGSR